MTGEFQRFQKTITTQAVTVAIVAALVCVGLGVKPMAKGILLGTVFSVLNFILMALCLPMRLNRGPRKVFLLCLGSLWGRFALMAAPLVVALKFESFEFFATAAGLFMVQGVLLIRHVSHLVLAKQ